MEQKFVIAGLAALGLLLFSPKVRQNIGDLLEQLAVAQQREAQRIEAERRAALHSEAVNQIQLPPISQSVS